MTGGTASTEGLRAAGALRQELGRGLDRLPDDRAAADLVQGLALHLRQAMAETPSLRGAVEAAVAAAPPPATPAGRVAEQLLRAMLLGDAAAPTRAIDLTAEALRAGAPDMPLARAQYIFQGVNYALWSNGFRTADPGAHDLAMRRLWQAIVDGFRAAMPAPRAPIPAFARRDDLVVLLTGQFMHAIHQPSVDILEFAHILMTRLGRRVVLVNTADGPVEVGFPLLSDYRSNVDDRLLKIRNLSFHEVKIPFVHLTPGTTTPAEAADVLDFVAELRPGLVMSFGTASPVADLCRDLTDVVAIPFGTYLPVAQPTYFGLPRPASPSDRPALELAGVPPERVIPIFYGYSLPETGQPARRAELGVPEDALVAAVIGLRLDSEVTDGFAATLEGLLRDEPRLFFLFVGPFEAYGGLAARFPLLASRARAIGLQHDVRAVLKACDLYLNPPRGGGGASAAYALAEGVPAFTLPWGDVSVVAGPDFHLKDLKDFAAVARVLGGSEASRADWSRRARDRYAAISSREEMLRMVLDGVKARRG
ncbi:MAG TPA: hypothetical protein VEB20_08215 [Azospirillaceae bacterium]|nr:hypothetical protein [Azospirillaceae bacterium]